MCDNFCRLRGKIKCWLTALLTFRPVLPSDTCRSRMYHLKGPLQNVLSRCDWAKSAHLKAVSRAGALPKVIAALPQSVCNRERPSLLLRFSHLKSTKNNHLILRLFMGRGYYDSNCALHILSLASVGYAKDQCCIFACVNPSCCKLRIVIFVPNVAQSANHSLPG